MNHIDPPPIALRRRRYMAAYTQGRSDGGGVYRYIYPPKISPPKIFMGVFFLLPVRQRLVS